MLEEEALNLRHKQALDYPTFAHALPVCHAANRRAIAAVRAFVRSHRAVSLAVR